ncbi:uncharacterized protein LOC124889765 [Capsicum annuum]|uniref:uncharacterized protein LOC124889765 n=1 Tax=Capsicum annuum TaxID=4072 RepID=UPI001FB07FDD|nr:uncharacterized protein LOC124889765 [Capsicum annuum]
MASETTLNSEFSQTSLGTLNSSDPLYQHPSENAGSTLFPVVFYGTGYRSWRREILRALFVKNKLDFINGKSKRPTEDSPTFGQWERCDNMVTSWLLNSLSRDLADSLQYINDARELWKELEDRHDQTNDAKLYQLQKEINDISQGNLDITRYYTRIKRLWEELSTLNTTATCNCKCTCGAKAAMHKAEQDRRLIQFLMGLNKVYTAVRGNIMMINPLPNIAQCFSILIQEEKQPEVKPHNQLDLASTLLNIHGVANTTFRTNYQGKQSLNQFNRQRNSHYNKQSLNHYNRQGEASSGRNQFNGGNSNGPGVYRAGFSP